MIFKTGSGSSVWSHSDVSLFENGPPCHSFNRAKVENVALKWNKEMIILYETKIFNKRK